jgi:hypothetical protein
MVPHQRTNSLYRRRPVSRAAVGPGLRRDDGTSGATLMTAGFAAGLLLTLLSACADSGAASDNDKRPVFYGGVSGGHTGP